MKRFIFTSAVFTLCALQIHAQTPAYEKEKWTEKPEIHRVESKYDAEDAIVLSDNRRIEYIDDAKNNIFEYYTQHRVVHINNDRGIEFFNKIYLPVTDKTELLEIKARTILPGGKVIELDRNNIKDIKEEDGNSYKIFAFEGLEKGCEIEFSYTVPRNTNFFGISTMQGKFPVLSSSLDLFAPVRLQFDIKSYNLSPVISVDTIKEKRIIHISAKDLKGADEEKYSAYQKNLGRVEYKLSYNNALHKDERLFTWNDLAKKLSPVYYNFPDKDIKRASQLTDQKKWSSLSSNREKIIAVENYFKKEYAVRADITGEDAYNFEKIIRNKTASEQGLIRLYCATFKVLNISYQIVFAADRHAAEIDDTFENWNNCDNILLYFPSEGKFLAPTRVSFRYPWIVPAWGGAKALFCKSVVIGNLTTALAEIKFVPLMNYDQTFNNIDLNVKWTTDLDSLIVDGTYSYGGYAAAYYRSQYALSNSDEQREMIKSIAKSSTNSENMISYSATHAQLEESDSAFVLNAKVKSGQLVERAGKKLLVKIGMMIGNQVEMYQEKPRQFPIYMEYPHKEYRTIQIVIPEGYVVKNPNDLKISQIFQENGIQTMGFTSDFELNGNIMTVRVREEYRNTYYPISQYEDFKRIINASSDFNKIVLILEKN